MTPHCSHNSFYTHIDEKHSSCSPECNMKRCKNSALNSYSRRTLPRDDIYSRYNMSWILSFWFFFIPLVRHSWEDSSIMLFTQEGNRMCKLRQRVMEFGFRLKVYKRDCYAISIQNLEEESSNLSIHCMCSAHENEKWKKLYAELKVNRKDKDFYVFVRKKSRKWMEW